MGTEGVKAELIVLEKHPMQLTWHRIVQFITSDESPDIDFAAVGNNGANYSGHSEKKYIGSTANGVIGFAKINVLFVV